MRLSVIPKSIFALSANLKLMAQNSKRIAKHGKNKKTQP